MKRHPFLMRLWGRYVLLPRLRRQMNWDRAIESYERESTKIVELSRAMNPDDLTTRVQVSKVEGVEESSRFWSVAMVLEHLVNVGEMVSRGVQMLGEGKKPPLRGDIGKVKADEILTEFEEISKRCRKRTDSVNLRDFRATWVHPWFGPITAYEWICLLAVHQSNHRQQIAAIQMGLARGSGAQT